MKRDRDTENRLQVRLVDEKPKEEMDFEPQQGSGGGGPKEDYG